jgi:hypothetical protein
MTIPSLVLGTNSDISTADLDISAADLHSMRAEEVGVLGHTGESVKVKQ